MSDNRVSLPAAEQASPPGVVGPGLVGARWGGGVGVGG